MKKILVAVSFLAVLSCYAGVKINGVGTEYITIQAAVTNANNGDVLIVTTGVFAEAVDVYSKNITIDGSYNFDYSTKVANGSTEINPGLFAGSCIDITGSVVNLKDLELTGCSFFINGSGGGLDIKNESYVIVENCNIHNNVAPDYGGGINVYNSKLVLSNSPVENCFADYGGGLYINNSYVSILGNSFIKSNVVDIAGGGLHLINGSFCIISNTAADVINNSAAIGGGVACNNSTFVLCNRADIVGNLASTMGGGVFLENNSTGVFYGNDVSIGLNFPYMDLYPNVVTNGNGGAIYADNSFVVLSNQARVACNYATENGGAVYLTNSSAYINYANIGYQNINFTNYAGGLGGAIYAINSSLLITNNAIIMRSFADDVGGIFAKSSDVKIYDSTIGNDDMSFGNIADFAAGIFMADSTGYFDNVHIIGNQSVAGAGMYFNSTNSIIVQNSVISNNITYGWGGAGFYCASPAGSFVFDNSEIVNNLDMYLAGGVVWASQATLLMRNGSRICNNTSSNVVGGIFLSQAGVLQFENSEISGNHAVSSAGGIAATTGKVVLVDCIVNNNIGDVLHETNGYGGGVYLQNSELEIQAYNDNFLMISNSAAFGGGIYANISKISIQTSPGKLCKISGNSAMLDGGCAYFSEETIATISGNVSIDNNSAFIGGGFFITNKCIVSAYPAAGSSPVVKNNFASFVAGGIICYGPNSSLILTNTLISKNICDIFGGGMLILDDSELVAINSKFLDNFAQVYGAIGCGNSKLTIDSDFNIPNPSGLPLSVISQNTATNIAGIHGINSDIYIANTIFSSNYSEQIGAASIVGSTGKFVNVIVANNYGGALGDGLYLDNNYLMEIQNCTIANNYSNGVYQSTNGVPATLQNCIVWGHLGEQISTNANVVFSDVQGGFAGFSNITNDPLFVDPVALNYQVQLGSETINAGMTLLNVTNDCIGNPRPYDGDWDMGAYEFIPEPVSIFYLLFIIYYLLMAKGKNEF